jgi:dihydrofolate synthase/folylpolyglutamate synthase
VSAQVVGSNGKTSTTRLIEALLRGEGHHTALTTSPALIEERERIQIDGIPLTQDEYEKTRRRVQHVARIARAEDPHLPEPSDFELVTAMAFFAFAQQGVDFAVVEAGIGGTWDSTCILDPAVVVATSVSLEHTAILGDTIEEIARDKAGAIKPGSTLVLSDGVTDTATRHIFQTQAKQCCVPVLTRPLTDYDITLSSEIPPYQRSNIRAAIIAAEALLGRTLSREVLCGVLDTITFPGRFEILARDAKGAPHIIFDGAHNPEATIKLVETIQGLLDEGTLPAKPVVALGVFRDKDLAPMIRALDKVASAYLPLEPADTLRALGRDELVTVLKHLSKCPIIDRWDTVLPLLVTGSLSLYVAAHEFVSERQQMRNRC